jgi:hypothetical protein
MRDAGIIGIATIAEPSTVSQVNRNDACGKRVTRKKEKEPMWYRPVFGYRLRVTKRAIQELLESLYDEVGDGDNPFGQRLISVNDAPVGTSNQGCLQRGGNSDAVLLFGFLPQEMFLEPDANAFAVEEFTSADPRQKTEFHLLIAALPLEFERWLRELPSALLPHEDFIKRPENWRGPTLFLCPET